MKLQLDFEAIKSERKINFGDKITLLGSCFSDEMAVQLKLSGFEVESNPFGTIFHPTALANLILKDEFESSIIQRDNLFFSWVSSGVIYDVTKQNLLKKLNTIQVNLFESIKNSQFLFITFGTSFAYENDEYGTVVANCHKIPNSSFIKVLSSVGEMLQDWELSLERIYALNPMIQVVFTVSPVRHIKDGLIENNRSKARLIELTNRLSEMTNALYFPSYEFVIDVLRDYRFYKEDLIHPNNQAVKFVYNQLEDVFMSNETKLLSDQVRKLRLLKSHKTLHPESLKTTEFELSTKQKIAGFLKNNPKISW